MKGNAPCGAHDTGVVGITYCHQCKKILDAERQQWLASRAHLPYQLWEVWGKENPPPRVRFANLTSMGRQAAKGVYMGARPYWFLDEKFPADLVHPEKLDEVVRWKAARDAASLEIWGRLASP